MTKEIILFLFIAFILLIYTFSINQVEASECVQFQTVFVDTDNDNLTPNEQIQIFKQSTVCDAYLISQTELETLNTNSLDLNLELLGVTPENIAYAFSWGFGSVIFFWSLGFVIGVATGVIKKA
jgi:hypothetical protein